MRIQPPKTDKTLMNQIEFEEYILNHIVCDINGNISVLEFFNDLIKNNDFDIAMNVFLSLWPLQYQNDVKGIFMKYNYCNIDKGFGPVPHWIDCKERLPGEKELNKNIIIIVRNELLFAEVTNCSLIINNMKPYFSIRDNKWYMPKYYADPTHWFLLPEIGNNLNV